ncbi:MAG TPA: hypothetical protein VLE96_02990, partial [Chlamydiales bacterium]|nr:hypothetical protein [Chlamydiales bacterium]
MSRIDSSHTAQHAPLSQKKDPPPGLWDPLAGLFKKKVPPAPPADPSIVPNPIIPELPATFTEAPVTDHISEVPSGLEVQILSEANPLIPIDQVEILQPVGTELAIQNVAQDAISEIVNSPELPLSKEVTLLTPIKDPKLFPLSFSRKVFEFCTVRTFTYLALLVTAIALIYFLYTKVWQKKPIPQKEEPTQPEEIINEAIQIPLKEEVEIPVESVATEPKYQWLKTPSDGLFGGIVGGIIGFFLSKFTESKNESFQSEIFRQADLKYFAISQAKEIVATETATALANSEQLINNIFAHPKLAQTIAENEALKEGVAKMIIQDASFSKTLTKNPDLQEAIAKSEELAQSIVRNEALRDALSRDEGFAKAVAANPAFQKAIATSVELVQAIVRNEALRDALSRDEGFAKAIAGNKDLQKAIATSVEFAQAIVRDEALRDALSRDEGFVKAVAANPDFQKAIASSKEFAQAIIRDEALRGALSRDEGFAKAVAANPAFQKAIATSVELVQAI